MKRSKQNRMPKVKKRSSFPIVFSLLLVLALLIGALDAAVYIRFYRSGWYKNKKNPAVMVDMTEPSDDEEIGRLYYAPLEKEHIVETNETTGSGYIDNEVLIVAADGVSREQIAELAVKYFILE